MITAVGGNTRYPSLESIAALFRAQINDSFSGASGSMGEGLIMFDQNPDLLTFMNAAIRDTYSDLRNVGDPSLILDNYLLIGIPALTTPDPTVQVSLSYAGYFNGYSWSPQWALPIGCQKVERLWERQHASNDSFSPMTYCPQGLPPVYQSYGMGQWEIRQSAVWMPGCMNSVDLRLRCSITFPDFLNPATLDFSSSYVPVVDCQNNVVDKMLKRYARRFAPDMYPLTKDAEAESLNKLRLEVVRAMQSAENQRIEYGTEATGSLSYGL